MSQIGPSTTGGGDKIAETYAGRKIAITGGLGFIGSNLARRLVDLGSEVLIIDTLSPDYGGSTFNIAGIEDGVRMNISDVRDEQSMRHLVQGQHYLFNLAGQTSHADSMKMPYLDMDINSRAQLSILEACRHYNPDIKVVFASTRQLYGNPQYLPVDEDHPISCPDVNAINKLSGEWYHLLYRDVYGIRSSVLRLTNTYGPRMRVKDAKQMFLGVWFRLLIEGKPLQVFGDGSQIRDFNYVDDVVEAFLLAGAMEVAEGEVFNLGAPDPVSLKDVAETMIERNGGGDYEMVPFPAERKAIDIGDYYGDYTKIKSSLGWEPKVFLAEGLDLTLAYYHEHRNEYW